MNFLQVKLPKLTQEEIDNEWNSPNYSKEIDIIV